MHRTFAHVSSQAVSYETHYANALEGERCADGTQAQPVFDNQPNRMLLSEKGERPHPQPRSTT